MITRLDHFELAIPPGGEEQARKFYCELLGLQEEPRPNVFANPGRWFRSRDVVVHVGVDEHFKPQTLAHPALCASELDSVARLLASAGYKVEWDDALPTRRRLYTADPFGNRIELIQDGDGFGQKRA
jgi:catechol 2,3-dioxygenase-like lactoylglutathione lyase family enzyme